ncbi:hypothetical protein KY284_027144 [Solanum tuberosum]|nr:hypothetical protein KY284_027144 [Solanum tuberosum]
MLLVTFKAILHLSFLTNPLLHCLSLPIKWVRYLCIGESQLMAMWPLLMMPICLKVVVASCFFSTTVGELRRYENPKNKITVVSATEEEIWGAKFMGVPSK